MKQILLITVCEQNSERIVSQIQNLEKHAESLLKYNIEPVFVHGDQDLSISIPYKTLKVPVEERYTNLYRKLFAAFEVLAEEDFEFIIKIDDDTLFNIDLFGNINLKADYIGREHANYSKNFVSINLPMYNIEETVRFYPAIFDSSFSFMTGDFYMLRKSVVQFLIEHKEETFNKCSEREYICEDQLVGYILRDSNFNRENISWITPETDANILQVTRDIISIHPINNSLFQSLLKMSPQEQFNNVLSHKRTNLWYRKAVLQKLENDLRDILLNFANSKKAMGLG